MCYFWWNGELSQTLAHLKRCDNWILFIFVCSTHRCVLSRFLGKNSFITICKFLYNVHLHMFEESFNFIFSTHFVVRLISKFQRLSSGELFARVRDFEILTWIKWKFIKIILILTLGRNAVFVYNSAYRFCWPSNIFSEQYQKSFSFFLLINRTSSWHWTKVG
jgi:hypothetical protein